jgi:hypothetical protein
MLKRYTTWFLSAFKAVIQTLNREMNDLATNMQPCWPMTDSDAVLDID